MSNIFKNFKIIFFKSGMIMLEYMLIQGMAAVKNKEYI